jgi:hypothetical protein
LKNGKAAAEDAISNQMVKSGGLAIVEWLVRLFNLCINMVANSPLDSRSATVSLFKGEGDKKECKELEAAYLAISLLRAPRKVYGRVIHNQDRIYLSEITEVKIRDEQGGFIKGRSYVDKVFTLKCVCVRNIWGNKSKIMFLSFSCT